MVFGVFGLSVLSGCKIFEPHAFLVTVDSILYIALAKHSDLFFLNSSTTSASSGDVTQEFH